MIVIMKYYLSYFVILLFTCLNILNFLEAHEQPGLRYLVRNEILSSKQQSNNICLNFQSYHIHVMFLQNNQNSTKEALDLQNKFMKEFSLSDENLCQFLPSDPSSSSSMCIFEVQYSPSGPFVTAQTTYFIPIADYETAVSFTLKNRGSLDVFVHPNTGCGFEDHIQHSLWSGNKWYCLIIIK